MMMVDSISATTSSIINGFHPHPHHHRLSKNKNSVSFIGFSRSSRNHRHRNNRAGPLTVRSLAMELTKEAQPSEEEGRRLPPLGRRLRPPPNRADDPSLHNPLRRQERLGCGWLAAIFEWEGVIIEADPQLERQAWAVLAQEEGRSPPPAFVLRRIEGMKNEQAVSEVLCWSREPAQVRRLSSRKEEIHRSLRGGGGRSFYRLRSGSSEFLATLLAHKIPVAVASTRPGWTLREAMEAVGVGAAAFEAVVAAEDVHRGKPDPEMFAHVAQLLGFVPERCIVFGNSNSAVEAAHDARMKCVAVASRQPVYELGAADLVVRRLDELSVVDLKNLAAIVSPEFEPEVEMEEEEEPSPSSAVAVDDPFW